MNELKEIVDNQDFTLRLYNICSDLFRNDQIPDVGVEVIKDLIVNDLMQLIETYTAKRELEARIDELELAIHAASDIYHHEYTMRVQMIENRISQLKHQLSSQLCVWILARYNRKENA